MRALNSIQITHSNDSTQKNNSGSLQDIIPKSSKKQVTYNIKQKDTCSKTDA